MSINGNYSARQLAAAAASVAALATGMAVGGGQASASTPAHATATVASNVLTVRGTTGSDTVAISLANGDPNTVVVDLGYGVQDHFARSTFTTITAFLGAGDDVFSIAPSGDTFTDPATVFGGPGNDAITGGDGNDTLFGEDGNDRISGGDGTDIIFGGRGNDAFNGNKGNDTEFGGAGNDTAVWNPGEGSDVIDGGTDADTLAFNGAAGNEVMSLSNDAGHAIFARDIGSIRMDLVRVEQVTVAELGGADAFTVNNLAGTDVTRANLDLGPDDGANDTVTVNGTTRADTINVAAEQSGAVAVTGLHTVTHIVSAETYDHLQVNGRGGRDHVDVSKKAATLIGVDVSFGAVAS